MCGDGRGGGFAHALRNTPAGCAPVPPPSPCSLFIGRRNIREFRGFLSRCTTPPPHPAWNLPRPRFECYHPRADGITALRIRVSSRSGYQRASRRAERLASRGLASRLTPRISSPRPPSPPPPAVILLKPSAFDPPASWEMSISSPSCGRTESIEEFRGEAGTPDSHPQNTHLTKKFGILRDTAVWMVGAEKGRGGVVARLLNSHRGESGSIPGGVITGSSRMRIVPDDAAGGRVFSGISRFPRCSILTSLHRSSVLKNSIPGPGAAVAERLAYSHPTKGEPGSISGQVTSGFSNVGVALVFLRNLPFPPPFHSGADPYSPRSPSSALKTSLNLPFPPPFHSGADPYSPQSPSSALKTSLLRPAQISSLAPIEVALVLGKVLHQSLSVYNLLKYHKDGENSSVPALAGEWRARGRQSSQRNVGRLSRVWKGGKRGGENRAGTGSNQRNGKCAL
ncbi:hypothetical protein PR048_021214 [Dryococelus australis]|uniref:Uncharacterized protein n=1 Tax=Dryococelus australis TaxID=614101 RepID=A0ABQ9GXL1_9NEOP|nr:hypothetical protein PR048_021214 [Dryococelus australis]